MIDPGTLEIMLTGKVDELCNVSTCPAFTGTITVPAAVVVNSSGNRVNEEKQAPDTGTPSRYKEKDQAGVGAGNGGVNCPSTVNPIE